MAQKQFTVADQETVDEIKTNIGNKNDTGGTTLLGSLFAKLNKLLEDWTSIRAGYIDTIKTDVSSIKTNTAANSTANSTGSLSQKLSYIISTLLGATGDTGGTKTAGTITAKLNALLNSWTSTRAGYIDTIKSAVSANSTASKTGSLSQKEAYIISLLEDSTNGLSAIKSSGGSAIKSIQKGILKTSGDYGKFVKITNYGPTTNNFGYNQTISSVDIDKCIIRIIPLDYFNDICVPSNTKLDYGPFIGTLISDTTLQIMMNEYNGPDGKVYFNCYWEVIEFN